MKEKYAKAREDAQLAGVIPTTPEGAHKPERVPASAQKGQPMPELIAQAIAKGWAVPEHKKPELIEELVAIILDDEMPPKQKIAAFNALRMADQTQYEREHPEAAGKAKGPAINGVPTGGVTAIHISVESNKLAVNVMKEHFEQIQGAGMTAIPPPMDQLPTAPPRFDGDVESGAVATDEGQQ